MSSPLIVMAIYGKINGIPPRLQFLWLPVDVNSPWTVLAVLDRKHFEVSKTVRIMSVNITELIWQEKTRGESIRNKQI